jgi:hypothetical protein
MDKAYVCYLESGVSLPENSLHIDVETSLFLKYGKVNAAYSKNK